MIWFIPIALWAALLGFLYQKYQRQETEADRLRVGLQWLAVAGAGLATIVATFLVLFLILE